MQGPKRINRAALNGRAAFCGAAFLVGIGLALVAERVGAPEGAVRAFAGLFALPGLALIGLLARSSALAHFFAANRAIPEVYGALGFAAAASGLALCLLARPGAIPSVPLAGAALGVGLGGLLVGPHVRRANASGLGDFFALRLGGSGARWPMGIVLLVVGVLTAIAGYEAALDALVNHQIASRASGVIVLGAALALIVAPGGLASVVWGAAACAGALALALALPILAQVFAAAGDPQVWLGASPYAAFASIDLKAPAAPGLAGALGVGALGVWPQAGIAARNSLRALRAGASGVLLAGAMAAGALVDAAQNAGAPGPAARGAAGGVLALAGLALAASGLFSAVRAFAPPPHIGARHALASQRLALARGAALFLVGLGGALLRWRAVDPGEIILAAIVLSLAFVAPAIGLTFSARATGAHAMAAFLVSLAALAALAAFAGWPQAPEAWLANALVAAALGFCAGWAASLFAPPLAPASPDAARDAYFELPDGPRF